MSAEQAKPIPRRNVACRIYFPIYDAIGGLITGAADLDSEVSIDGATFADVTSEAVEIATDSGIYYLDLTADEMDGDCIVIQVRTSDVVSNMPTVIIIYPDEAGDIKTTLEAGVGAYVATITIQTTAEVAMKDVIVWVNDSNDSTGSITAPQTTNASGVVTLNLTAGNHYVFCNKAGYSFSTAGTEHRIIMPAANTAFTKPLGTAIDLGTIGAEGYVTGGFIARAIADFRLLVDEPVINAKYTDAVLLGKIEQGYAEVINELNRLNQEPIVARFNVTAVSGQETYKLPTHIGAVRAIYISNDSGCKVFYDSKSEYSPSGRQVWREGDILHIQPNAVVPGDAVTVEYLPSGTAKLHNGTCTVDTTGLLVTFGATPVTGSLDTHANAYAGSLLRVLRSTESTYDYQQERTITAYDPVTRVATLDVALDPNPQSGTTYYEIAPPIHQGLDLAISSYVAMSVAAIEGDKIRHLLLEKSYQKSIRNLRLNAFYSNLADAGKQRADTYNGRSRPRRMP